MRRSWIAAGCSLAIVTGALLVGRSQSPTETNKPGESANRFWIKVTFGLDEKVADWDGHAAIQNGEILAFESWGFEKEHTLDAKAFKWTCSTKVDNVRERSTYAEPFRGLLLELQAEPETVLHFNTKQGYVRVRPSDLRTGHPTKYVEGRAMAERLGTSRPLFGSSGLDSRLPITKTEEDFPTLTVDSRGHRLLAWIGYDDAEKTDRLQTLDLDDSQSTPETIESGRLQTGPQLVTDSKGTTWLFWSSPNGDNWDIHAAQRENGRWSKLERITTAVGSDFHLATAAGPNGEIWLTWQSFRKGNGDIFAKRHAAGVWSADIAVTTNEANDWEPSLSIDPQGTAWIGYDTYRHGNYDVYLTSLSYSKSNELQRGKSIPIAATADFEAHASVEATQAGEVWVAYDAAGPNWGKDNVGTNPSSSGTYNDPLHANRRVGLRVWKDGRLHEPQAKLPQRLDTLRPKTIAHKYMAEVRRFYELPQLVRDGEGRLWLLFRLNRQGYAEDPIAALWEVYATTFSQENWLEPILLPISAGRQDQRVGWTVDAKSKRLSLAWSDGHHMSDTRQTVRVGGLPAVGNKVIDPPLQPIEFDQSVSKKDTVSRGWTMQQDGKAHRVYFGDLHRHTDISWCYPTIDGSLVDAHRYALDAAQLDFLAVTDHSRDTDPYPWWRTQKAVDLFRIPGRLTTIYAYERSNGTPGGGHRNVFFLDRDWPVYRSDHHYKYLGQAPPGRNDPPAALYPHLRGKNAFTAAHTPAYSPREMRGTWSYGDADVEPLVEIYQGFRRSFERPDGSVAEEASIWYALDQGYRLGFIASSDHVSTHKSYACVWATGSSRKDLFEAMRARRTYAATDRIQLEFRSGKTLMGSAAKLVDDAGRRVTPEFSLRVLGTSPIEKIDLIRNRKTIASTSPQQRDVRWTFHDDKFKGKAAWYYVRVQQADGNMAWGSPIWFE